MSSISTIKIELSDWLYNAGIVGLANIFDMNDIHYNRKSNYIEFDSSALENFEESYFNYFIRRYEKFTSWYKIISFEDYIEKLELDKLQEKNIKELNDYIDYTKKQLKSNSYKSGYLVIKDKEIDLLKEEKVLQKIKKTKKQKISDIKGKILDQIEEIRKIINYMKKDEVKRIIVAKNVIYDIIQDFWLNVSFLNKNNSKKNMYHEYKSYFIDSTLNYIEKDKSKAKYNCFICDRGIIKLSDSYDLTWINKIGVDMSRKTSHFWNFNGDSFICPICNLVYSCIPAGFTVVKGKGLFINNNINVNSLIKVNKHVLDHNTTIEELEQETYFNIIENINQASTEHFQKEIENIQIVKLDSNNNTRPYTFNVLSKDKLNIISKNKNMLKTMIKVHAKVGSKEYLNLYSEVINRLYDGRNQFGLINKLLYLRMSDKFKGTQFISMIIKINNSFLKGGNKMVSYKTIDKCKSYGIYLRKAYLDKKAENKIGGISYRLLNALKTKNTSRFMDTVINAYMYLGKQIPTTFVEALKDVDKFQTMGYSFVLGLQGENEDKKEDNEEVKVNE